MEESKQPSEEEKQKILDELIESKRVNASKHPHNWPYDPQNVFLRNE